jgi:alpha-tubulin suppressor-like RCC1 family protein
LNRLISFVGNIDTLICLIKNGANLILNDFDKLTPLEHLSVDKSLSFQYKQQKQQKLEIYSFGSNQNYNLGNGTDTRKVNADLIEYFVKKNINIVDIVTSKFHTVFRDCNGFVYSCGFGNDGRLGHGTEDTIMTPKLIKTLKEMKCHHVAASRNNTYFLCDYGLVYSCGKNEFHQLGHHEQSTTTTTTKSLIPKLIHFTKGYKNRIIKQIECSSVHCILVSQQNEVFALGFNAGQLGLPNEMVSHANSIDYNSQICYISEARLIPMLSQSNVDIKQIACTNFCTVCLDGSKQVLYILNNYKCKQLHYIKEVNSPFVKIRILGGRLYEKADDNCFIKNELKWMQNNNNLEMGEPLLIVGQTENNLLYMWQEQETTTTTASAWRNLKWTKNKKLIQIVDFDLNETGIILCTTQGTCYSASFGKLNKNYNKSQTKPSKSINILTTINIKHLKIILIYKRFKKLVIVVFY